MKSLVIGLILGMAANNPTAGAQDRTTPSDWVKVQSLLGGIHGVFTAPPANLITEKYTSGALMGNGDIGVVVGGRTASEQTFWFGKSDFWGTHWNLKYSRPEVSILSLGSLTLSSPAASQGAESVYRVEQHLLRAEVLTTMKLGSAVVHLRSWTADGDNVFVTELSTEAPSVPLKVRLAMPGPASSGPMSYPSAVGVDARGLWATRENDLSGPKDYVARTAIAVRLVSGSLTDAGTVENGAVGSFTLKAGAPVQIVTVFESDASIGPAGPRVDTLRTRALSHVARLRATDVDAMRRAHSAWWKAFWLRSTVDLHDPVLMDYYYGALYVLGSSSRPGKLPPWLWGNFITTDDSKWGGRYFMNYNEEAPYYGVFSSNHADLAEPYNRMVLAQLPWQRNRTAEAGYQGVSFQRTFSPFTIVATPPDPAPVAASKNWSRLPADQKSNATFSLLPSIQYFEYTQDMNFLRTELYPAMKQLDVFWRDFAVRDASGRNWVFEHSSAHEGGDDVDPNLDIGFALRIEHELLETSRILGVDAQMRPTWEHFGSELAPYPTGMVDGKRVFYIAASVKNSIKDQGLFEPGDQPIDLEGTVFPGENLAIGGKPDELRLARNSMEEMNSWSVTPGGNSNNGFCKIFPIAARIGWPADDLMAKLKAAILYHWRASNLTDFQGGGGIETSGTIEAIDSMLLQHEGGTLRLFPDWPVSLDVSFTRLRAKGAYLVSSAQRGGHVTYAEIVGEHGGTLNLLSPWGHQDVLVDGRRMTPDAKGIVTLRFAIGERHMLAQLCRSRPCVANRGKSLAQVSPLKEETPH